MFASVNYPGSSHFAYFHGTKAQCQNWLADMEVEYRGIYGRNWDKAYYPAQIFSDKAARKIRYANGEQIFSRTTR